MRMPTGLIAPEGNDQPTLTGFTPGKAPRGTTRLGHTNTLGLRGY